MAEKEGLERVTTRYIPTSRTSILYNHAFLYNYIQDVMKHIILAAALALATAAQAQQHDWENQYVLQKNRMPHVPPSCRISTGMATCRCRSTGNGNSTGPRHPTNSRLTSTVSRSTTPDGLLRSAWRLGDERLRHSHIQQLRIHLQD